MDDSSRTGAGGNQRKTSPLPADRTRPAFGMPWSRLAAMASARIPSRLRPGANRRRLEARIEVLEASVATYRTALIRTFDCTDIPVPADLITAPEDVVRRLAAVEAWQQGQDEAWKAWREIAGRRPLPSAVAERPAVAGRRQRLASAGLRVLEGGAR